REERVERDQRRQARSAIVSELLQHRDREAAQRVSALPGVHGPDDALCHRGATIAGARRLSSDPSWPEAIDLAAITTCYPLTAIRAPYASDRCKPDRRKGHGERTGGQLRRRHQGVRRADVAQAARRSGPAEA